MGEAQEGGGARRAGDDPAFLSGLPKKLSVDIFDTAAFATVHDQRRHTVWNYHRLALCLVVCIMVGLAECLSIWLFTRPIDNGTPRWLSAFVLWVLFPVPLGMLTVCVAIPCLSCLRIVLGFCWHGVRSDGPLESRM